MKFLPAALAAVLALALAPVAQAATPVPPALQVRPMDASGNEKATTASPDIVEHAGATFSHISTNATTTAKSGAGILHKVCINTKGASANTATVYDNAAGSGTVIAVLDTTSGVGCLTYDLAFSTGLTIVTATGTAGDLTIAYR